MRSWSGDMRSWSGDMRSWNCALPLLAALLSLGSGQDLGLPVSCYNCRCPRNFDQQCGSDGRTYQNPCMRDCAKQNCPELTHSQGVTQKAGPCPERTGLRMVEKASATTVADTVEAISSLPSSCYYCRCPRTFDQQCGSDGRTYQNPCMRDCARQKCPELTQSQGVTAQTGPCPEGTRQRKADGNNSIKKPEVAVTTEKLPDISAVDKTTSPLPAACFRNCQCPRILSLECGSDRRTYPNLCMFLCTQRNCPEYYRGEMTATPGRCHWTPPK